MQNQIEIHESIEGDSYFYFSSYEYVKKLTKDINIYFTKQQNKHKSKITIDDIENLADAIINMQLVWKNSFLQQKSLKAELLNIMNSFTCLEININSLKQSSIFFKDSRVLYGNLEVNMNNIRNSICRMNDLLRTNVYFISEINKITNEVKEIIEIVNQNINLINAFKVSQFKLLKLLQTTYYYMNVFLSHHPIDDAICKFDSFLIDQNLDPIVVFLASEKVSRQKNNLLLINKYIDIILVYFKMIPYEIKDLRILYTEELNLFYDELLKLKNQENFIINEYFFYDSISKLKINLTGEMINRIYFNSNNNDSYFQFLLNISKYHIDCGSQNIYKIIKRIFFFYDSEINEDQMIDIFNQILLFSPNHQDFINQVNQYFEKNQFYFFDQIFQLIIKYLVNNELFSPYLDYIYNDEDLEEDDPENNYIPFFDLFNFSNFSAYFKFTIDKEFCFDMEKNYNQYLPSDVVEREKNIFKENFSEFVVHIVEECQDGRLILPYFSFQTLDFCLYSSDVNIQFTFVDIIVIILEIAIGMNALHSKNEFHGYFSASSIYISSNKNAFIGEIAYDKTYEGDQTRIPDKVFYRAPEFFNPKNIPTDINAKKLSDIYAFGIIMFETITRLSVQKQMKNNSRYSIYKIMNDGLRKLFFESGQLTFEANKIFDYCSFDIRGDSLIGIKAIIEKCLNKEPNERFQSFGEIIQSIKNLAIYEKNKDEIEFRIEYAKNTVENKCQLSNILETYYRGHKNAVNLIGKIMKNISESIHSKTINKLVENGNDIIKNIYNCFQINSIHDL